ncbi:MAG: Ig-like domain-containing protein [Firmicutes bacterium]|nr:Ig-like domain-containing protein [Bacillota bacterium]
MKKYFKKNRKSMQILVVLLSLIFACTAGFAYANTESAAVTEANYILKLSPYDSVLGVGDQVIEGALDLYRLSDNYRNVVSISKSTPYTVESFQPEVLTAEITRPYPDTSPNYYALVLNAISPGAATIRVANQSGTIVADAQVTVLGPEGMVIEGFPEGTKTVEKSRVITLEKEYTATFGEYYSNKFKTDEEIVLTSSNPKVAAIETGDNSFSAAQRIRGVSKGTATITATFVKEGALQGIVKTFDVAVTERPKATAPKLIGQLAGGWEVGHNGNTLEFVLKAEAGIYEIWRSTSPTKNFKRVGKVTVEEVSYMTDTLHVHGYPAGHQAGDWVMYNDSKNVKQNTKYYYKVRVKYTGAEFDHSWSKFSKVQAYWTAPKPVPDKKVKHNKSTKKVTIPKQPKKVNGYIYSVGASKHLGYNIFGQEVRYRSGARRLTTKRSFKVSNIDGMRVTVVYDVIPYVKHGKYYYVSGYKPMKNIKKLKEYYGADKYV